METALAKPTRRSLLDHFSVIEDTRQPCKVMYPLPEVLLPVVRATIAGCDDYDEIADWGEARLEFPRRIQPYYRGVPCEDWPRVVMSRIDPDLFAACFTAWANEQCGEAGVAVVAIDAIACNPTIARTIARTITEARADYLLAVKDNQPTLHGEMRSSFDSAPADDVETLTLVDNGHGRLETRRHVVSGAVDWRSGSRRYPGEPRFAGLTTIGMVESTVEHGRIDRREGRPDLDRAALPHLVRGPRCGLFRARRARPLDHRKPTPLGARRPVQGRFVPLADRPWRPQHGHRPTLRTQSRARNGRSPQDQNPASKPGIKTRHQNPAKTRRMGPRIPMRNPQTRAALTCTRCPACRDRHLACEQRCAFREA